MKCRDKGYIDALEVVLDGGKLSLTASAVPLAIIAAQVGVLVDLESVLLKLLVTVTILIFTLVSGASLLFVVACRSVLAKEKLFSNGDPSKGLHMLNLIEQSILREKFKLDENYIIFVTKTYSIPAAYLLLPGWILSFLTLAVAVWQ